MNKTATYLGITAVLVRASYFLFWNTTRLEQDAESRVQTPATRTPDDLCKQYPLVYRAAQLLHINLFAHSQFPGGFILRVEIRKRCWLGLCIAIRIDPAY